MATIPPCPDVPRTRRAGQLAEYQISTITPMFGGGVHAGEVDLDMPVRATAVRGQLQFWWRATIGAACADHEELFERSKAIWGSTKRASAVSVEIAAFERSTPTPCATYRSRGDDSWKLEWVAQLKPLAYALFPFQGEAPGRGAQEPKKLPSRCVERLSFTLRLRYPSSLQHDVAIAVWAWVSFGGIGARTRRGCGALSCRDLAPADVNDLSRWFRAHRGASSCEARPWPTLPDRVRAGAASSPLDAWRGCIEPLQRFRQGTGIARNSGSETRPGRSRYPEPEAIRTATRQRDRRHARMNDIPNDAFPRAEMGLPIVFHFHGAPGDPKDTQLYPHGEGRDRMASPLILKPLALGDGKAVPLAIRLQTPPLERVVLVEGKGKTKRQILESTKIRGAQLAAYPRSPLAGSPDGSALEAFMASLQNFQEIR